MPHKPSCLAARASSEAELAQRLHPFLADSEARLVAMLAELARTRDYSADISTLPEASRASVQGLNEAIAQMLAEGTAPRIDYDSGIGADPPTRYGIGVAERHGLRGVPLGMFLGNFKDYRDTYLRLVALSDLPQPTQALWSRLLRGFFDRAEVGMCAHWGKGVADVDRDRLFAENRRLVNEKNKYLTIFESLHDPVFLIDAEGRVENMNFAAVRLLSQGALPGSTYYGAAEHPQFADLFGRDLAALSGEGEQRIASPEGPRWVAVTRQDMLDYSGKFTGTVVSFNDVTAQHVAREEAEALARAKTDFLATMSHEIRTPIHSIGGIVELLRHSPLPQEAADYVDAIDQSVRLLTSIVSEILDFSRIEAGGLHCEAVRFSLSALFGEVGQIVQPLVARKPAIGLRLRLPDGLPCVVGDPTKLRQILVNLAGNAVKFTEAGEVVLALVPLGTEGGRARLRFEVSDTGPGIAPDMIEEIFKPFTQQDNSIERKHGGTGLGLAICRRLAALMGADLTASSRLGEGSRFCLEITLPTSEENPADCGRAAALASCPARALRVLIVEDDPVNRLVATSLVRQAGHMVTSAANGAIALAALAQERFDLVLSDLNLPDLSGFDLARRIRAQADPQAARLPIVALSAHGPAVSASSLAEAGIDDFLAKPFHFGRLEEVLRRATGFASPRPISARQGANAGAVQVDPSVLRGHFLALGGAPALRIVTTFCNSVLETAAALEAAQARGDGAGIAALAHRLKGSARQVGLLALAEAAQAVEAPGAGADLPALILACRSAPDLISALWAQVSGAEAQAENT